jgi:hypothetical protein
MSNYITEATTALHDAIRAQGKTPEASLSPDLQQLYVLLVLTRGTATTLADVHDAWACARAVTRPDHPDLVLFEELSSETAEWDRPFMNAIHAAARTLSERASNEKPSLKPYTVTFETPVGRRASALYWVADDADGRRQTQEYLDQYPSVRVVKVNGKDV